MLPLLGRQGPQVVDGGVEVAGCQSTAALRTRPSAPSWSSCPVLARQVAEEGPVALFNQSVHWLRRNRVLLPGVRLGSCPACSAPAPGSVTSCRVS